MIKVYYIFVFLSIGYCWFSVADALSADDFLNKCISSGSHKNVPGKEGKAIESYHCTPWQNKSCCTWNTTSQIDKDGTLTLYGIIWDQCPQNKTMSDKCKEHFMRDTCFYECSPNLGPWIVEDNVSNKTRKERVQNVPICKSDCDTWFEDCSGDFTCNDNWGTGWNWSKKGTPDMCPKQCKTIKEYFKNAKQFCEKIFDDSFKYYETDDENCMNLTPVGSNNLEVAKRKAGKLSSTAIPVKVSHLSYLSISLFSILYSFRN